MQTDLEPGRIRLRGVSRSFRIVHERNLTLKETLLRRGRTKVGDEELWALRDVDLDVAPGEAVGVIGQNGSGKSTMLKLVAGIIPPDRGHHRNRAARSPRCWSWGRASIRTSPAGRTST